MRQKKNVCIVVTRNNKDIDIILSNSLIKKSEHILISDQSYFISKKKNLNHLTYPPGFGSSFTSTEQISDIIASLDSNPIDTAYLMFFDKTAAEKFGEIYNKNLLFKHTLLNYKTILTLDLFGKNELDILKSFERSTIQIIKSKSKLENVDYNVLNNYDPRFYDLYNKLSKIKKFSDTYLYSENDFKNLGKMGNIFFFGLEFNKVLIGGSFFRIVLTPKGKRMDYLLSANLKNSKIRYGNTLIIWYGIKLAIKNNCSLFNFGGGVTENDSLFNFKLSFGTQKKLIAGCRVINRKNLNKRNNLTNMLKNYTFP